MSYHEQLKTLLNDTSLQKVETIQSLWSGYGEVTRFYSPNQDRCYVVKMIKLQRVSTHPRGWNSDIGHQRKLDSFYVEASFYRDYSNLTSELNYTPKLIAEWQSDDLLVLVMEDLQQLGYATQFDQADDTTFDQALAWLAHFHGQFMFNQAHKLWPIGTYWHLETRQEELFSMPTSRYKDNAESISQRLNEGNFQTLVHGDAKLQNMCFDLSQNRVAGVDFQYVGKGVGVKDLAYLSASSLSNEQLFNKGDDILRQYLALLETTLRDYQIPFDPSQLKDEYTRLYPFAWADYYRFLLGWNAQSAKISDYMVQQSELALNLL